MKGTNPENPAQRRVFYHLWCASDAGEKRHPSTVMSELAAKQGFKILAAVPQTLFDGWDYWIEGGEPFESAYVLDYPWKPIGLP